MSKEGSREACSECGGLLKPSDVQCSLCGTPVNPDDVTHDVPPVGPDSDVASYSFCPSCGASIESNWKFCAGCGASVPAHVTRSHGDASVHAQPKQASDSTKNVPVKSAPATADPSKVSSKVSTQILTTVAAGFFVVALMFVITVASRSPDTASSTQAGSSRAGTPTMLPLTPELAERVAELEDEISATTDVATRHEKQHQLVVILLEAGRFDRAGAVQQAIAEETNTAASWSFAGDLYFDWMNRTQGPDRNQYAGFAISAYKRSLELEPDNLDVRTTLGIAYMNDPANQMLAIQEINAVLAVDPNHILANFYRGVMLARIERFDQASEQFEKVLTLTSDDDPLNDQSAQWLEVIRSQTGS